MRKISLLPLRESKNILFIAVLMLSVITLALYSFSIIDQKLAPQYRMRLHPPRLDKHCVNIQAVTRTKTVKDSEKSVINILKWTDPKMPPFDILEKGTKSFQQCEYNNCFISENRAYLKSVEDFDAIIFNGKSMLGLKPDEFPDVRCPNQKYIYGATESAHYYPVCEERFDGYFNFTYTYKLDSDLRWGYLTVYDLQDHIIGPKNNMTWPKHMDPISDELVSSLKTKSKAAAWFVSNCNFVLSGRKQFVRQLQHELQKYDLFIDIYGACGPLKCPKRNSEVCFQKVKKDYYFYLAFENSFDEDYVTEKLITALNNDAVPIVYGAADYSRFMPPGSYLHAMNLGVPKLAAKMNEIINNKTLYHDFFRWRNHFKYKDTTGNYDVCTLCEYLNKQKYNFSTVKNLRTWWNGAHGKCKSSSGR